MEDQEYERISNTLAFDIFNILNGYDWETTYSEGNFFAIYLNEEDYIFQEVVEFINNIMPKEGTEGYERILYLTGGILIGHDKAEQLHKDLLYLLKNHESEEGKLRRIHHIIYNKLEFLLDKDLSVRVETYRKLLSAFE